MPRRHRMRCRRARGRGQPSRPPMSLSHGRDLNFSIGWSELNSNPPVNMNVQLSLQLPAPDSLSSLSRRKKRPHKSTIPPEPAFIPHKMKALLVQSASSGSKDSSDSDGNSDSSSSGQSVEGNSDQRKLYTFVAHPDPPASPRRLPFGHALSKA